MYKISVPIEYFAKFVKGRKYSNKEVIMGIVEKKFFTLRGAMKFLEKKTLPGIVVNKNGKCVFEGYVPKLEFKHEDSDYNSARAPDNAYIYWYRSDYYPSSCYNPLKIIASKYNKYIKKEGSAYVGANEKGFYIAMMLYDRTDIDSFIDGIYLSFNENPANLRKEQFDSGEENYYDFAYLKNITFEDLKKAEDIYNQGLKEFRYVGCE